MVGCFSYSGFDTDPMINWVTEFGSGLCRNTRQQNSSLNQLYAFTRALNNKRNVSANIRCNKKETVWVNIIFFISSNIFLWQKQEREIIIAKYLSVRYWYCSLYRVCIQILKRPVFELYFYSLTKQKFLANVTIM